MNRDTKERRKQSLKEQEQRFTEETETGEVIEGTTRNAVDEQIRHDLAALHTTDTPSMEPCVERILQRDH